MTDMFAGLGIVVAVVVFGMLVSIAADISGIARSLKQAANALERMAEKSGSQ